MKYHYKYVLLKSIVIALFVTGCTYGVPEKSPQILDTSDGLQTTELVISQTNQEAENTSLPTETKIPSAEILTSQVQTTETEEVTPYQFLCLACGNAEILSFEYTLQRPETESMERVTFQSILDPEYGVKSLAQFTAWDMNGNAVSVRELEMNGSVYYIMDESRIIKTYDGPAEDFLMNRMCNVVQSAPVRKAPYENGWVYDYQVSHIEEDMSDMTYRFFMSDGSLEKLICLSNDSVDATYVFTAFQQALLEPDAFTYPEDYTSESFNYSYTGEYMPPWWELGNDE